ncbi:EAL domain-containing protein [Escherichia coli]
MSKNSICHNIFTDKSRMIEECIPFFQPVMDTNNKLYGVEVLARWKMPNGHILPPDVFISQVTNAGLSAFMTSILLRKTARILQSLKSLLPVGMLVSFNVDTPHYCSSEIICACKLIQRDLIQLCPTLVCELTERREWGKHSEDKMFLQVLERENILVALDDFGTKYSNLDMLSKVHARFIKIDSSFVCNLNRKSFSQDLIEVIIFIAKKLSLYIIAEGIENKWQYDWLKMKGVDFFQGYILSPPLHAEQFSVFVRGKRN